MDPLDNGNSLCIVEGVHGGRTCDWSHAGGSGWETWQECSHREAGDLGRNLARGQNLLRFSFANEKMRSHVWTQCLCQQDDHAGAISTQTLFRIGESFHVQCLVIDRRGRHHWAGHVHQRRTTEHRCQYAIDIHTDFTPPVSSHRTRAVNCYSLVQLKRR